MLDHLLPLIYRDYEFFDESNKENFGYVIRRRSRPVSATSSTTSQTPPRPPRRASTGATAARISEGDGIASARSLKRRRSLGDDGGDARGRVKKQATKEPVAVAPKESTTETKEQRVATVKNKKRKSMEMASKDDEHAQIESTSTPRPVLKKAKTSKMQAKQQQNKTSHVPKQPKTVVLTERIVPKQPETVVTTSSNALKQSKTVVMAKKIASKRIPLQDITHLYVNEHARALPRRERFVGGLTTSVAIRFF
ncbi:hypothetical protein BBJ28_00010878 [Nothophytophthora sp. Chile5]|nr:hypothetical protein BBJ28_00010878 [Nothophytophthora sp. Chile5]